MSLCYILSTLFGVNKHEFLHEFHQIASVNWDVKEMGGKEEVLYSAANPPCQLE